MFDISHSCKKQKDNKKLGEVKKAAASLETRSTPLVHSERVRIFSVGEVSALR